MMPIGIGGHSEAKARIGNRSGRVVTRRPDGAYGASQRQDPSSAVHWVAVPAPATGMFTGTDSGASSEDALILIVCRPIVVTRRPFGGETSKRTHFFRAGRSGGTRVQGDVAGRAGRLFEVASHLHRWRRTGRAEPWT